MNYCLRCHNYSWNCTCEKEKENSNKLNYIRVQPINPPCTACGGSGWKKDLVGMGWMPCHCPNFQI